MFDAFLCYVVNTYPEVPRLCRKLDGILRTLVKDQPMDAMMAYVGSVIPDIEKFLLEQDGAFPTSAFVIPSSPDTCMDLLEFASHGRIHG